MIYRYDLSYAKKTGYISVKSSLLLFINVGPQKCHCFTDIGKFATIQCTYNNVSVNFHTLHIAITMQYNKKVSTHKDLNYVKTSSLSF